MSAPNIVDFCNACKAGNLEKVQELVENGVDINGKCDSIIISMEKIEGAIGNLY